MIDADVIATNHGYECRYTPTVMSGPVFRWTLPGERYAFEVSASRDGVMVQDGRPLLKPEAVVRLIRVLDLATYVHRRLAANDRDIGECNRLICAARETAQ